MHTAVDNSFYKIKKFIQKTYTSLYKLIGTKDAPLKMPLKITYAQNILSVPSKQLWVSDRRLHVLRPFYSLRITPTLPHDSGLYQCRLETDPLFALAMSTGSILLIVMGKHCIVQDTIFKPIKYEKERRIYHKLYVSGMAMGYTTANDLKITIVRPLSPSKPEILSVTERSVTLSWKISSSQAHKPILQQAVLIRRLSDKDERIMTLQGNNTTAVISGLMPITQYAFSIRLQNAAGISEFSPFTLQTTLGEALSSAPKIRSIQNTSDGCIKALWEQPVDPNNSLIGYRIMIHRMSTKTMREWYIKSDEHVICGLPYNSKYQISVEADNGYGYSPSALDTFYTDESIPDGPPENIKAQAFSSSTVEVSWNPPKRPNGKIIAYQIYIRLEKEEQPLRLKIHGITSINKISYNISDLQPYKTYALMVSAFTKKGEGDRSNEIFVTTDHQTPSPPEISNITFNCKDTVTVYWSDQSEHIHFYYLLLEGNSQHFYNTTSKMANLQRLTKHLRYSVKVSSVIRSILNNSMPIFSQWSKDEIFLIDDQCKLKSSLCSSPLCESIILPSVPSVSLPVTICAFIVAIILSLLVVLNVEKKL
ncbi:unnamed protein product [Dracunculus medinensis]|uniref:Protein-tyrosine-phosphatase n=1 Tax=Dracunculus medinensis TaxID=318479 RepID=A0A158Q5Y9_DRAME|nr:unnamed protein product [Dracunculus medinensis]